jgi:adenine-specific DNA-methyltransferase
VNEDNAMQKLILSDAETHSLDLMTNNIAQLRMLFPERITEGAHGTTVNVDVLKALVGDPTVADSEEKYGLNWHGKRRARQLALTPSSGTLRPAPEESVDWEVTKNLMIEGDNLEVLKLLQKSYAGQVKLIYIDPPYNTGGDFVYPDDFRDSIKNYLQLTGQLEGGRKLSSNTEASGRFHTDWLNMMYPRLKLAKSLLSRDGFIFISIDHNEVANLRAICTEIFGEENFRNMIVVRRGVKNVQAQFDNISNLSSGHEYVLCYSARADVRLPKLSYEIDESQAGKWDTFWRGTDRRTLRYELFGKTPETGQWRWSKDRAQRAIENYSKFIADKENKLSLDDYYLEHHQSTNIELDFVRLNDEGVVQYYVPPRDYKLISDNWMDVTIKGNETDFDTEKHTDLLTRIINWACLPDDTVLDFFAGSGTTGHAVMAANSKDNGKRRFVLVQLPEPVEVGQYKNIADMTKKRLRNAITTLREETQMVSGDLGFRVFKLASSNIRAWEPDRDNLAATLEQAINHLRTDRTEQDVLYELLLKLGLDLSVPIAVKIIAAKTVYSIGGGVLLACLERSIARTDIEALGLGIIAWYKAIAPASESVCVFLDSAFADDVSKTNISTILQQNGLANVRSI